MTPSKPSFAAMAVALAAGLLAAPAAPAQILGPPPAPAQQAATGTRAADPLQTLRTLGLTPIAPLTRDEDHLETEARSADGRRLSVSFDLAGRLWEIEDADHDTDRVAEWRDLEPAAVERIVSGAGFTFRRIVEEKRRHVVVRATTREGDEVALHIDRNGYISKQTWLRS